MKNGMVLLDECLDCVIRSSRSDSRDQIHY